MALASMLSALREVILSTEELPDSYGERETLFRNRFPALSSLEIEDLAKLDPDRVRVYTRSIFAGEGDTLLNIFRLSGPHVMTRWERVYGEELTPFALAAALHEARPWKSNTTEQLAWNFVQFCTVDHKELLTEAPFLGDLMMLEFFGQQIRRSPDDGLPSVGEMLSKLEKLTVGDLLAAPLVVRPSVKLASFEYDVVSVHRDFFFGDGTGKEIPVETRIFAAGGRNAEHRTAWATVSEPVLQLLESARSTGLNGERFAEHFIAGRGADENESEERLFLELLGTLATLMRVGVLAFEGR